MEKESLEFEKGTLAWALAKMLQRKFVTHPELNDDPKNVDDDDVSEGRAAAFWGGSTEFFVNRYNRDRNKYDDFMDCLTTFFSNDSRDEPYKKDWRVVDETK